MSRRLPSLSRVSTPIRRRRIAAVGSLSMSASVTSPSPLADGFASPGWSPFGMPAEVPAPSAGAAGTSSGAPPSGSFFGGGGAGGSGSFLTTGAGTGAGSGAGGGGGGSTFGGGAGGSSTPFVGGPSSGAP